MHLSEICELVCVTCVGEMGVQKLRLLDWPPGGLVADIRLLNLQKPSLQNHLDMLLNLITC